MKQGDEGDAVVDLRHRLESLGVESLPDEAGLFGSGTRSAVEAFQRTRGLRVDGICGPHTWVRLVEAGSRLGDRLLYLRRPMLRGDDVAELQRMLSALGFDTGHVDGIFGDLTGRALADFQRNAGIPPDGICGSRTLRELRRVMPRGGVPELVTAVRARERLRSSPPTLLGRTVAIGEEGGLSALVSSIARRLASAGARAIPLLHPDPSSQASAANASGAEVYLGLRLLPHEYGCQTAYYSGYNYESPGGRHLAELVLAAVTAALSLPGLGQRGMSVPILRETRMPAVLCEFGPAAVAVERSSDLARSIVDAFSGWVVKPLD
jgi:N-acetylmuramoyl-L-alanine amidase